MFGIEPAANCEPWWMSKLRGVIKNFSESIRESTFQAIKGDLSGDLRNCGVAPRIVPPLLRVTSAVDKSHAMRVQTGFSSCFATRFYVIAFYHPPPAVKSAGYYTISSVFRVTADKRTTLWCRLPCRVRLPANPTRPWTNADIPFRVRCRRIM